MPAKNFKEQTLYTKKTPLSLFYPPDTHIATTNITKSSHQFKKTPSKACAPARLWRGTDFLPYF